ncbi:MAG TPA: hypothetical protein PLT36_03110 [Erysipelotrichaceae bacterium]|nr:hypothetical protein [Erysipelotrichaceae bacterium]HQA85169.1 hypothetical protein [Erysipelotrichaceae bacterium]
MSNDIRHFIENLKKQILSNGESLKGEKLENIKKMVPYLLVNVISFYLLPIVFKSNEGIFFVLLVALPIICFVTAIFYGIINSLNMLYPVLVGLFFVPAVFIYLNESALFYVVIYGILALVGNFIGMIVYYIKKK